MSFDVEQYQRFIAGKRSRASAVGFDPPADLNRHLFPWQADIVRWCLRLGRGAMFERPGLGKTLQQLAWGECVVRHTNKPVVILCPLAVGQQTVEEATKFGIGVPVRQVREAVEVGEGINVVNYERLHKIDASVFGGVILDESSILKSFMGKTKNALCDEFAKTPYRLCCTATPAPNDLLELGNHAAFLGIMASNEMLARWFDNDSMVAGGYALKPWGAEDYWDWVASWSVSLELPSDLGYPDDGYVLPPLNVHEHIVHVEHEATNGMLFGGNALSATTMHKAKRKSTDERAAKVAELVAAEPNEPWIVWCDTNYEADALREAMPSAIEIRGSDKTESKESRLQAFTRGDIKHLVTKPDIAGFGLNWQHCARAAFVGLGYSYERWYQAICRNHRFGQTRPVECHIVGTEEEQQLADAVWRKGNNHQSQHRSMVEAVRRSQLANVTGRLQLRAYEPTKSLEIPAWLKPHKDRLCA